MPEALIDVPIESLPFVDERSIEIAAPPEAVWSALLAGFGGLVPNPAGRLLVRGLGCVPGQRSGSFGTIGSTVPGFIVTRSVRPAVLALMGEHRFSRYALVFRIDERVGATSRRCCAPRRGRSSPAPPGASTGWR